MTQAKMLLTQEISSKKVIDETWICVVNHKEYSLNKNQAVILQQAISSNSRGIVLFDTFAISIPYIQEFYRSRISYKTNTSTEKPLSTQEKQNYTKHIAELKNKFLHKQ